MNSLYIYGAHFLEALAISIYQAAPTRLWITLGPREIIIKQLAESLQPALAVQMVQPAQLRQIRFDPRAAYILSAPTALLQAILPALQEGPPLLLVLIPDPASELKDRLTQAGIQFEAITDFPDLAKRIAAPPSSLPVVLTIDPAAVKSNGDLVIDWMPDSEPAPSQGNSMEQNERPRRKVLVIAPFMPYPLNSGSRIRIYEDLAQVKTFADISLAAMYFSYHDLPAVFHLRSRFSEVIAARLARGDPSLEHLPRIVAEFSSPDMGRALQDALERTQPALIHLNTTYAGAYAHLAKDTPLLLEEHNIEYDVVLRSGLQTEYQELKDYEQSLWRLADHCIAVTRRDMEMMTETIPAQKITLLPNGVNTRYFRPADNPGELRLVFLGTLDYPPNQQAIENFWEYVWPRLRTRRLPWYIIGSGIPSGLDFVHTDPLIQFLRDVPDVRPYLDANAIMVVPLQVGGGSRLKILTALAMGCPIVSTTLGCEGLDVVNGKHILIADDPDSMYMQVTRLAADPQLRLELSRAGRDLVETSYDWGIVLKPLQALYESMLR